MKYIIVGLGSFGASLGVKLTAQGNEVIGIDINMSKVNIFKEKLSHTIQMDATDEYTVPGLPLKETDVVVIAIGEEQGDNIMATALFKNLQVKRLISRAVNPLHEQVLQAIGVDEIVHPEEETAERWAKKLSFKGVVDSFELSEDYSIVEVKLPERYNGKAIRNSKIREEYKLLVLTTISKKESKSLIGKTKKTNKVQGLVSADDILSVDNLLVIYGANKDIKRFLKDG